MTLVIFVGGSLALVQPWIDWMQPHLPGAEIKSEFAPHEQASKYLLLVMWVAALVAHRSAADPRQARLAAGFMVLAMLMYAAESNFIRNTIQPLLAGPILLYLLVGLRARRLLLLLLGMGVMFLTAGAVIDLMRDHPQLVARWESAGRLAGRLSWINEEATELWGMATMCLLTLYAFLPCLVRWTQVNRVGALGVLVALAPIAWGNGFLHFEYHRPASVVLLGATLSGAGCLGLAAANRWCIRPADQLLGASATRLFVVVASGFWLLPLVYRMQPKLVNLILWGSAAAFVWWRCHGGGSSSASSALNSGAAERAPLAVRTGAGSE